MVGIRQNEQSQVELLAAMRQTYSRAKYVIGLQWFFGVPFAVILAIAVAAAPKLKVWSVFIGFVISLSVEFGFEPIVKTRSKLAAQMQELFDCRVFELPWSKYHCGAEPDIEDVCSAAKEYVKKAGSLDSLKDWYSPAVDQVPLALGRLICQQSNLRWDVQLRRKYRLLIYAVLCALVILLVSIAVATNETVPDLILHVLGTASPALMWGVKEIRKQTTTIEALSTLKSTEDRLWKESLSEPMEGVITIAAREIQNEIFSRRASNPLIFDFLYEALKPQQEEELQARAGYRLDEARKSILVKAGKP